MTDLEKAIVMAYTGYVMLTGDKLGVYYDYVKEKLGRPIMTHELACDEVVDEIKRAATDDFYALCMHDDTAMEAQTISGWISVKDRLPMLVETVLFTGKRYDGGWFGTKRGYFDGTLWHADDFGTIYTPVTHWMPLPDPPKEVSEE